MKKIHNYVYFLFIQVQNSTVLHSKLKKPLIDLNGSKVILFFTPYYERQHWLDDKFSLDGVFYSFDTDSSFSCPKKCLYTDSREYLNRADLVVVSGERFFS